MSRHLVTDWNPLYAREEEQHLSVLLDWARHARCWNRILGVGGKGIVVEFSGGA